MEGHPASVSEKKKSTGYAIRFVCLPVCVKTVRSSPVARNAKVSSPLGGVFGNNPTDSSASSASFGQRLRGLPERKIHLFEFIFIATATISYHILRRFFLADLRQQQPCHSFIHLTNHWVTFPRCFALALLNISSFFGTFAVVSPRYNFNCCTVRKASWGERESW